MFISLIEGLKFKFILKVNRKNFELQVTYVYINCCFDSLKIRLELKTETKKFEGFLYLLRFKKSQLIVFYAQAALAIHGFAIHVILPFTFNL